jgi:hypothetical protein
MEMTNRVQAKSKAMDTSVFHSGLIRMLVMEDFKKRNIAWDQFISYVNIQLNSTSTPQSKLHSPFPIDSVSHTETRKKRKGKHIAKDK